MPARTAARWSTDAICGPRVGLPHNQCAPSPPQAPFGEIAGEFPLSTHTIKAQARSIYRKLGASTRSQAVTQARELGLLDG